MPLLVYKLCSSSSPQGFPIAWNCRNGFEYHYLCCSVPPPLTHTFHYYFFYTCLSTWFSVFLSVSFLVLVHLTFFVARALRPFSTARRPMSPCCTHPYLHIRNSIPLHHCPQILKVDTFSSKLVIQFKKTIMNFCIPLSISPNV